jgi:hypothetical protein
MSPPDEERRGHLKRYWIAARTYRFARNLGSVVAPTLGAVINGTTGLLQERAKAVLREVLEDERSRSAARDE